MMKTLVIRAALAAVVLSGVAVVVMLTRSVTLERDPVPGGSPYPLVFDEVGAPQRLAGALAIRTLSAGHNPGTDEDTWAAFHSYLAQAFPRTHEILEKETVSGRSLLLRWPGTEPELGPILLTAHMDVVPVQNRDEEAWRHPPFAGIVDAGYIWGRGAVDNKGAMFGILEAVEASLESGFSPRRTILLGFGHDGESGGLSGARQITALLESRGIHPDWVLGEGLYLVTGMVPGIQDPLGVVAVAEKGRMEVRLTARSGGGATSMPPRSTALGTLSAAVARLEETAFPAEVRGPAREFLETLGPYMDPGTRLLVANLWLLGRPVARALTESSILNTSLRTTIAPAVFEVDFDGTELPSEASALLHLSIAPWDSPQSVLDQMRSVLADLEIEVAEVDEGGGTSNPTVVHSSESRGFQIIRGAIHRAFPDVAAVVPGLAGRGTDIRHYSSVSESVYGFSPFWIDDETLREIHGDGERVRVSVYLDVVRFYGELIRRGAE